MRYGPPAVVGRTMSTDLERALGGPSRTSISVRLGTCRRYGESTEAERACFEPAASTGTSSEMTVIPLPESSSSVSLEGESASGGQKVTIGNPSIGSMNSSMRNSSTAITGGFTALHSSPLVAVAVCWFSCNSLLRSFVDVAAVIVPSEVSIRSSSLVSSSSL